MAQPAQSNYSQIPIFNPCIPKEGPRTINVRMDFTNIDEFEINLLQMIQSGQISCIQTVFADNPTSEILQLEASGAGHLLRVRPYSQGYYPFFVQNPPLIYARSQSSSVVNLQLLNVPLPAATWEVGAP